MTTSGDSGRAHSWARAGAVSAVAVLGFAFGCGRQLQEDELPVLGQVPAYTLTNQLGEPVSSIDFDGKVQLVTFLFPYCTTYCPLIAAHLVSFAGVLEQAGMADRVQIVAFDVDPESTGPAEMRAFMEQYGWDPHDARWEFLVGPPAEMRRVVTSGFFIDYRRVAGSDSEAASPGTPPRVANALADEAKVGYDVIHNDALVVVDAEGRIRRMFEQADRVSDEQLLSIVQRLLVRSPTPWRHEQQ